MNGREAFIEIEHIFKYHTQRELECFDAIANSIRMLEIIKDKKVNIALLMCQKNFRDYNDYIGRARAITIAELLTEKEFDLLKEFFGHASKRM